MSTGGKARRIGLCITESDFHVRGPRQYVRRCRPVRGPVFLRCKMANLKSRQLRAIEALLEAPTVSAACHQTGIPRRTIENWLREDLEFQRAFAAARERAFGLAIGRLAKAANKAVTILIRGMEGEEISQGQRMCARDILTFASQARAEDVRVLADEIKAMLKEMAEDE